MSKENTIESKDKIIQGLVEEILIKRKEESKKPKSRWKNPVFATIIIALIGFIGTTTASIINSINETSLKTREFEFEIIKLGLEQPSEKERVDFLSFIVKLNLIKESDVSISLDSILSKSEEIPYVKPKSGLMYFFRATCRNGDFKSRWSLSSSKAHEEKSAHIRNFPNHDVVIEARNSESLSESND